MKYKSFEANYKSDDNGSTFSGLASVFGNVDLGGDVVEPGAFAKSLAETKSSGRKIPILWQHDPSEPIGYWKSLEETDEGLRGEGVLLVDTDPLATRTAGLLKSSAITGLSIGYNVERGGAHWDAEKKVTRLTKLDLKEVSVVTFPMNEEARVDMKAIRDMSRREIEMKLTQDAGFSRTVARGLMSGGLQAIGFKQDADEGLLEIADLLRSVRN